MRIVVVDNIKWHDVMIIVIDNIKWYDVMIIVIDNIKWHDVMWCDVKIIKWSNAGTIYFIIDMGILFFKYLQRKKKYDYF